MEGSYKDRGPILNYTMAFVLIIIIIIWAFATILGWATIGRNTPQIAWYITGGLISLPIVALSLFSAMFILGEYSPSIYRDPALIEFILSLGGVIPLVFMSWWYWDLGVRCNGGSVAPIEAPMCTTGGTGQVMIVWSMAAVSTLYGLFILITAVLSFADLYFRRLKTVTEATVQAAKSVAPTKLFRSGGGGGSGEGAYGEGGEEEEESFLDSAGRDLNTGSQRKQDLLESLGLSNPGISVNQRRRRRRGKASKRMR